MFPAQWRQILQQRFVDRLPVLSQGGGRPLQIHGVPQHDSPNPESLPAGAPQMRIPAIVGTPKKRTFWSPPFYAQVVTMGQLLVLREHHDDDAGSPPSNPGGGHFAATGPAPHRPR